MERSPIKDIEIKHLLKNALTDKINDRDELIVTGKNSDIAVFASILNEKIEPAT